MTDDTLDPCLRPEDVMGFLAWVMEQDSIRAVAPELHGLDVPILLPGEPVPATPEPGDEPYAYLPDGTVCDKPWPHCLGELPGYGSGEYRIGRATRYRAGTRLDVLTDFIPVNLGGGEGPPLLWETQVFHGPGPIFTRRYASRAAALRGHRLIVHALDTAQRARRKARR